METTEIIKAATEAGLIVRSKDEEAAFLETHKKAVIEKELKGEVFKIHSAYAKDFEEVLGIKVPDGEKPYRVLKKEAPTLVGLAKEATTYKEKVVLLEKQIKDGNTDGATKAKLDELQKELDAVTKKHKDSEKAWELKIAEKEQSIRSNRIQSELQHSLVGMKFTDKSLLPEAVRQTFINATIGEVMKMATVDESGVITFKDQNGETIRDPKTLQPKTVSEVMTERLDSIIDKGINQPGLGNKPKEPNGKPDLVSPVLIPGTITTRLQLTTYLQNLLNTGQITKEQYDKSFQASYKELKIA